MSVEISREEFNRRFMLALTGYPRDTKHLASGHERHPLLRSVLLHDVQQDVKYLSWSEVLEKWGHFIGLAPGQKEPEESPKRGKGRPLMAIPLKTIYDTLKLYRDIGSAAAELHCSRGYIYQELKKDGKTPREIIQAAKVAA